MIYYKSVEEIERIRESSILVSKTLAEMAKLIEPGVTTLFLDQQAEAFIRDHRAVPGFKGYRGYPKTLCTSVNNQVVHGIPSDYILKEGDIVSIDCGVLYNKYYGDSAYTFAIGEIDEKTKKLTEITKESLFKGIEHAKQGLRVGDIGNAVQQFCEGHGYSVVRELVGHGIGKSLHEEPEVPNFGKRGKGSILKKGMVICIEPMINMGRKEVVQEADGWTIRTSDRKASAHFELTVAIDNDQPDILSTFGFIEEILNNNK